MRPRQVKFNAHSATKDLLKARVIWKIESNIVVWTYEDRNVAKQYKNMCRCWCRCYELRRVVLAINGC